MRSKLEMVAMRVQQMAEIVGLTVKVQTVDWEDMAARAAKADGGNGGRADGGNGGKADGGNGGKADGTASRQAEQAGSEV